MKHVETIPTPRSCLFDVLTDYKLTEICDLLMWMRPEKCWFIAWHHLHSGLLNFVEKLTLPCIVLKCLQNRFSSPYLYLFLGQSTDEWQQNQLRNNIVQFLDLGVAKSLQSTRTVTDAADDADVLTTTGYTCWLLVELLVILVDYW